MKKNLILVIILIYSFSGYSQKQTKIIKDIFSTQTHDWIDCEISLPENFKVQEITHKLKNSRRSQYSYLITPLQKELKNNEMEMYLAQYITSDSSAIKTLSLFFDGKIVKNGSSFEGVVNDEILVTFKKFELGTFTYFYTISVKHNQDKEKFNLNNFKWFIDFVDNIKYTHNVQH